MPTGLLARCMSVSMLSSSSGDLATRTMSSAKIKCDRCSPSTLIPMSSQLIFFIDNDVLQTCSKEFG